MISKFSLYLFQFPTFPKKDNPETTSLNFLHPYHCSKGTAEEDNEKIACYREVRGVHTVMGVIIVTPHYCLHTMLLHTII